MEVLAPQLRVFRKPIGPSDLHSPLSLSYSVISSPKSSPNVNHTSLVSLTMDAHRRSPIIPQELVNTTIDHLHDDIKTLRSCSLVAHSWLEISRSHLFSEIAITLSIRTIEAFIKLLVSSTNVGLHIRRLRLQRTRRTCFELFLHTRACPQIDIGILEFILSKLPKLISLSFCDVNLVSQTCLKPRSPTPARYYLKNLAFEGVGFDTSYPQGKRLLDVLDHFSHVDNLVLSNISTASTFFYSSPIPRYPYGAQTDTLMQTHHLVVRDLTLALSLLSGEYLDAIQKTVSSNTLRSLQVSCSSLPQTALVADLIGDARNLVHFDFDLHPFGFASEYPGKSCASSCALPLSSLSLPLGLEEWRALGLASHLSLQSLVIRLPLDCNPQTQAQCSWVSLLRLLPFIPTYLTSIVINITFIGAPGVEGLRSLDWTTLEQSLLGYPFLSSVVLCSKNEVFRSLGSLPITEDRRTFIIQNLPGLQLRGLLRVY